MSAHPHLHARPVRNTAALANAAPTGLRTLNFGGTRESYLYVPPAFSLERPLPLVLLLHGAGGHAHDGLNILHHVADDAGLILVAPASKAQSWDVIRDQAYGADVELVDAVLEQVFAQYAIDAGHVGIAGFSDGASYALSLGLANGDLFTHIMAFSPGFIGPMTPRGAPNVFISHGKSDPILPVTPCSRHIVSQLQAAEYPLVYEEFDGGHAIPREMAKYAVRWFLETV
jgi:phospholipase/carboxylesterase